MHRDILIHICIYDFAIQEIVCKKSYGSGGDDIKSVEHKFYSFFFSFHLSFFRLVRFYF